MAFAQSQSIFSVGIKPVPIQPNQIRCIIENRRQSVSTMKHTVPIRLQILRYYSSPCSLSCVSMFVFFFLVCIVQVYGTTILWTIAYEACNIVMWLVTGANDTNSHTYSAPTKAIHMLQKFPLQQTELPYKQRLRNIWRQLSDKT